MEKKEAMKILKDFHDKSALFSVRTALHTIIPELRKSEDNMIKEELIKHLKDGVEGYMPAGGSEDYARWLAWVEKQGKERTVNYPIEGMFPYTDPADTLDGEIENIWNKLRNCDNTFTAAKSGFYEVIHHFANWLEKQGKETSEKEFTFKALPRLLEMIEVSDRAKAYTEKLAVALDNECYHTDAKIVRESIKIMNGEEVSMATMDEQKPVDNIEPKFKVGDWIVWQNKCYKVNYNGCGYELIDQNGLSTSLEYGTVDKSAHLWTIQDAKDGDVLQLGVVTVIFQEYICNGNCKCYYSVCNGEFEIPTKDESYGTFNATPATKEQRDTLLKAMAEAGYEWSEETHELKKISQRIISAEAKEALYDKPAWSEEDMKEALRTEYEKGRADTLSEMKSSWSEEDEVKINRIVACLENLNVADNDILLKDVDWLKSLKNRVQPKQKWNKYDKKVWESIIKHFEHELTMFDDDESKDSIDEQIDWLKQLKQRMGG